MNLPNPVKTITEIWDDCHNNPGGWIVFLLVIAVLPFIKIWEIVGGKH